VADSSTLPATDSAAALLVPAFKDLAKAMRRFQRAHNEGVDGEALAEAVHKVRVSSRRAGVTLVALRSSADSRAWKRLRRAVRRLRRAAGIIRDGDVHLRILRELERQDVGLVGLGYLIEAVEQDRQQGLEQLWKVFGKVSPRQLRAMGERLADDASDDAPPVSVLAKSELGRLAGEFLAVAEQDVGRPECLHEVRLGVKHVRYALELFEQSVPEEVRQPIAATLEEAQKASGEANDLMTLTDRLDLLMADLEGVESPDQELVAAVSGLRARFAGVAELRRRKFAEFWRSVNPPSLLAPLQTPVALEDPASTREWGKNAAEGRIVRESAGSRSDAIPNGTPRPAAAAQRNLWLSGKRLAVIDIGSNSIRLLAVELIDEKSWKPLAEERAMTRLAQGLNKSGEISPEAMARSVEAIGRFKAIAEKLGVTAVRAFATAAVREAENRADFMSLVQDRTGLKPELVSALDEGKLTHRSVARVYDLSHGMAAVVDIGGGSMEVVFSQNGVITENSSMPLGAVRLTEAFGGADAASGPNYKKMRRWVSDEIGGHVREHDAVPTIVVGCGGTFTTMLTLAAAARGVMIDRNSAALTTLGPVSRESLRTILKELRSMTLEQRLRVPGLPSDRADIVVAGFTAVERLLDHLGVSQVHVHPGGFREGLLLRMIDQEIAERARAVAEPHHGELLSSVREFAQRCQYERAHSEHVAALALSLFDQFRTESTLIEGLGDFKHERDMLEASAILHDVGVLVEYRRHHRHSQTMIRHADLALWEPRELELIGLIARYHRRSTPSSKHAEFAALAPGEQSLVRRLAAILRTADGLDRSHAQRVHGVRVRFGNREVQIEAQGTEDLSTDGRAAQKKADLLREVLGTKLVIAPAAGVERPQAPVQGSP